MADKVNEQVTDALTQTNVNVVAGSPAQALGMLYQMFSQAVGISAQNMTQQQAALNQISNAVVSKAVANRTLYPFFSMYTANPSLLRRKL